MRDAPSTRNLTLPIAVPPSGGGGTVAYQPIPGVDIVFVIISDAVE